MTVWHITLIYVITAGLWIFLSDRILPYFVSDSALLTFFQTVKGWLFVGATAGLLHFVLSRYVKNLQASEHKLQQANEELTSAYEELMATEEELRQQFEDLVRYQACIDRQNQYLNALHDTAVDMMNELDLEQLLADIVNKAVALGGSQHGYLYLLDEQTEEMEAKVIAGLALQQTGFRQKRGEGVVGRVWESGEPLIIHDYNNWEGALKIPAFQALRVSTGFPLKAGGKIIGVFGINYTEKQELNEEQIQLMRSFAELASVAVENARLHSSLKESQMQSRKLIEALPDIIYRLKKDGTLLAYESGKGMKPVYDFRGKIGSNITELLPSGLARDVMLHAKRALESDTIQVFEFQLSDCGRTVYRENRFAPMGDGEVVGVIRDITERREMEERLRYISLHDPLTRLYNRTYFEEELYRLNDARHLPVGIIVCDIDGLKLVNDSLGRLTGDCMLIAVANILRECFGKGDVVARIGGDEFGILMPASDLGAVERACRDIRHAVAGYSIANPDHPLSLSIGMSIKEQISEDINDVLKTADDNMYREKLHQCQSARSAIVSTLAKALEARDFVTDGHADRLQDIVEALAKAVEVPENNIADYRLLARFHDIGKVGIPDNILFKPGRLTPEEFEIMKRHCEIGYRIALASPDLSPIAEWILSHQEWWNGQGYPQGLKGQEIPLACRILALADAYDAMTNDRPYRAALSHTEALAEIERCAGKQFDPELAEVFKKVIEQNLQ